MLKWGETSVVFAVFSAILISALWSCSPTEVSGTASGGEAKTIAVKGRALLPDGSPAEGAVARIRPKNYRAGIDTVNNADGLVYSTTAGTDGSFSFRIAESGEYVVELTQPGQGAYCTYLCVGDTGGEKLGSCLLETPGGVSGRIQYHSQDPVDQDLTVFLYGLEHSVRPLQDGSFFLARVPYGTFTLGISCETSGEVRIPGIRVVSGEESALGGMAVQTNGCADYRCDSLVVAGILAASENPAMVTVTDVSERNSSGTRIVTCDLQGLSMRSLPRAVRSLSALQDLYLNDNELRDLPDEIAELRSLRTLTLSDNQIRGTVSWLTDFDSLVVFLVSGNEITGLPENARLPFLRILDIGNNRLTRMPRAVLSAERLEELYADNNPLTELPQNISNLSGLRVLSISGCSLGSLPASIGELAGLKRLLAEDNEITALPSTIGAISNMTVLLLTGNNLTSLPPELAKLEKIVLLSLGYNRLCHDLSENVVVWADRFNPDWRSTQVCN